jgi:phosphate:Na+ symporter
MDNPFTTFDLWAGLIGGLALFLFGMDVMTRALQSAAGDYMKDTLGRLTRNRFIGVGVGAFVTALIQSSSVTTVILVGFISAGLMSMSQSVAVIMGANIGTTITAQILAFDVMRLALPIIAVGFGIASLSKRNEWRQVGLGILGLGMVFFGMSIMSEALSPLRSYPPFVEFMLGMTAPWLAVAAGAAFTALVQSSSATTGILIVMASQNLIALEPAIAIALGANVGTCVTAGLACIGKPREAVRAAVVHTLFNVIGVLIWIALIPQLAEWAEWISPAPAGEVAMDHLTAGTPRQIANVHTLFNVANMLLMIGFTTQIARFVEWLIPDRPVVPDEAMLPRYLDDALIATPAIALEAARQEICRLGKRVSEMVEAIMPAAISGTRWQLEKIAAMDKPVDALHIAVIGFLGKVSSVHLTDRQSAELMSLAEIANDLENIGDRIATSMVTSAQKRIEEEVSVSPQTSRILQQYHGFVVDSLNDTLRALKEQNAGLARQVSQRKKTFHDLSRQFVQHGFGRLRADEPNRLRTYAREVEIVEILDGVFIIIRRIARSEMKRKH